MPRTNYYYLTSILLLLFLTGCKTPQPALEDEDFYTLINLLFQKSELEEVAIFHKTINESQVDLKDELRFEKINANFPVSGGRIHFEDILTQADLFSGIQKILSEIRIPRNRYINEALEFSNMVQKRKILEKHLLVESELVKSESMKILLDFETIDYAEQSN